MRKEIEYTYTGDMQSSKFSRDNSILGKVNDFQETFQEHERLGHNLYRKSPLLSTCDRKVKILDRHTNLEKEVYMFGSNNYLSVINDEDIKQIAIDSIKKYGIGSGGVPLLSGTFDVHDKLESELSGLTGAQASMTFSSGLSANIGLIASLLEPKHLIIHDKLNHASLYDGSVMSRAKMLRFHHKNTAHLEKLIKENVDEYGSGIMVVTDGVFSMDGDIADLPALLDIADRYGVILVIDEAHAVGVIGDRGRGTLSHHGLKIGKRDNIIVTGSLSKTFGVNGGYISTSAVNIDYLRLYARSNLYSTSLAPHVCETTIGVIKYMLESDIVEKLAANSAYLRNRLKERGFNILNSVTAAVPVIVGNVYKLTSLSKELLDEKNICISCIFPPVVPPNLSRIRINVMASHTKEDFDYLVDALDDLFKKHKLK